jgi:hypothetical protein
MSNNEEQIVYFENHKTYCGQKYVRTFPDEWILDELPETGRECDNCKFFGSWRGVMLGYCLNCAEYCYDYSRSFGFVGQSVEEFSENPNSATMTYLLGIDLEKIGDINENPEDTMENRYEEMNKMYEEIDE